MIGSRHLALAWATLASIAGCNVLAPVVGERPAGAPAARPCNPEVTCARLDAPPPDTFDETTIEPPDTECPHGRRTRTLTLTADVELASDTLGCVDLDVRVTPAQDARRAPPPTLTIAGDALARSRVHVVSETTLAGVAIRARSVTDLEIHLVGAIRLAFVDAHVQRASLELGGNEPIDPPEVLFTGGSAANLRIVGLRSPLRLRDTRLARSLLVARSIALERGQATEVALSGELVELLDVVARGSRFSAARMIVTGGHLEASNVERCGTLTLAAAFVLESSIAACDEPVDLEAATIGSTVMHGDVGGADAIVTRSIFGGRSVDVRRGILTDVALCGTDQLRASELSCGRCEPSAPSEVCLESFDRVNLCPGLCGATCAIGRTPPLVEDVCVE